MSRPRPVTLRDRATNRYLASGAEWSPDVRRALVVERDEAAELVRRFACEPSAVELVEADQRAVA
jgi:hypothetical protein